MKKYFHKLFSCILTVILIVNMSFTIMAGELSNTDDGVYDVNAVLSCYVNAMGGVEFGTPMLVKAQVIVENGKAKIKLCLQKSQVTIYTITCDTFVDIAPDAKTDGGVAPGTVGYYDKNGILQTEGVEVILSSDTALNPKSIEVNYVESITFPLDEIKDTYQLTMYVNSNVMGAQFGNGSSPATLKVDWSNVFGMKAEKETVAEKQTKKQDTAIIQKTTKDNATDKESVKKQESTTKAETSNVSEKKEPEFVDNKKNEYMATEGTKQPDENSEEEITTAVVLNNIEKEGLNIHYVGAGDTKNNGNNEEINKSDNKGAITAVVIIAVILALITGVMLVYKNKKKEETN